MARSFNLDDVSKALESTQSSKNEEKGVSFENQNLKLNTVEDGKSLFPMFSLLFQYFDRYFNKLL